MIVLVLVFTPAGPNIQTGDGAQLQYTGPAYVLMFMNFSYFLATLFFMIPLDDEMPT